METLKRVNDELFEKIEQYKISELEKRLINLGIKVDWESEKIRRFKLFHKEIDYKGMETIYYNDGSLNGLKIISFVTKYPPYSIDINNPYRFEMSVDIKVI